MEKDLAEIFQFIDKYMGTECKMTRYNLKQLILTYASKRAEQARRIAEDYPRGTGEMGS